MQFEDIVERVRVIYENADARNIFEHVAIQINVEGEGAGVFYIEIADRKVCVEPYDYYDKDGLAVLSGQTIYDLIDHKISIEEAQRQGLLKAEGDLKKLQLFLKVQFPQRCKFATTKKIVLKHVRKLKKHWKRVVR